MRDDMSRFESPGSPDPDTIQRFLAGESSEQERMTIQRWAGAMPDGVALADFVRDVVRDEHAHRPDVGTERRWEGLRARLGLAVDRPEGTRRHPLVRTDVHGIPGARNTGATMVRRVALYATATTCLFVALLWTVWRVQPQHGRDANVYVTRAGQQALVTLADGSRVTLAPQTTLLVPNAFGTSTRTVTLDGEAFFDVRPGARAPFLVHAGRTTTRVLGTAFDVRHYATDRETQVAVATGKVVVTGATTAHPSVTLVAGTVGVVTDSTAILISADSAARYTAWTSGMLVFHNVATTEILAALSRWYGYQFRIADSAIAAQNVTATFSTRSSSEALDNLKILLNVELTIDGDTVTLRTGHPYRLPARERSRRGILNPTTPEVGR